MSQAMGLADLFSTKKEIQQKPWMAECSLELVTPQNLKTVIDACMASEAFALDLETTGLNNRLYKGRTKDRIVGICLSPDGIHGYYAPLRHVKDDGESYEANIPISVWEPEFLRLLASPARAIFHNAKFDQEFLDFATGTHPWGNWDDPNKWEDTLILAYLRNSRERRKGLKYLSQQDLNMEMIELIELFPEGHPKNALDFSKLDPGDEAVVWYGASDAICTYRLYYLLRKQVLEEPIYNQEFIYSIEKRCSVATRWMERNGICIDVPKVKELISLGQNELVQALALTYQEISAAIGRKVMPPYLKEAISARVLDDPTKPFKDQLDAAKVLCKQKGTDKVSFYTDADGKEWPGVYDLLSPTQLGQLLEECAVPNLPRTEKSKQVDTSRAALEEVIDRWGDQFPFLKRIRRVRELLKALSTYLQPLWDDTDRQLGSIKVNFNPWKTDTGRFSTPSGSPESGGTSFFLQGIPAPYVTDRPACMLRLREAIVPRGEEFFLVAIDFSGVELRLGTNLSGEPMWKREYFRCSDCDHQFSPGDGNSTPQPPPPYCPTCGGDKIGDLHTLTALNVYGQAAKGQEGWKAKRQNGKGANFSLLYGGSANAVQRSTGCDKNESFRIKRQFDSSYTTMTSWWGHQHAFARQHKYVVTAFGRRYPLPDIDSNEGALRSKAERNSTNGPIQGTSADITKMAMWLVYRLVKRKGWENLLYMTITMHDELCFDIHRSIVAEAVEEISLLMTRNKPILDKKWPIPLTVDADVGTSWANTWNLNKCRHTGKWPEELSPWFLEGSSPAKGDPKVEVDRSATGGAYVYTLKKPLSLQLLEDLSSCILGSSGGQPIFIKDIRGNELPWPNGTVLVDPAAFAKMASDLGV